MRLALPFLAFAALSAACGQEIVTVQCDSDAHNMDTTDGGIPSNDSGVPSNDSGVPSNDSGVPSNDSGIPPADGGMPGDAGGPGCTGSPYCITGLTVSKPIANVREAVTFTPVIENPNNVTLTFRAPQAEIVTERRTGFPQLVVTQIDLSSSADANGTVNFTITEVPTYFTTTKFKVKLYAKGPGAMPEVSATADVTIRGNTVISGYSTVYSVASDGRPARSGISTPGRFLEGTSFIRGPGPMLVARDGTLIVYDSGTTPERLRRFELSGENVLLGDFEYQDQMGMPYIYDDQNGTGLTQLMDGSFALAVTDFSRSPDSAILIWNEDGTYARTLNALDPNVTWQGVSASKTANELLVIENAGAGRLIRLDPVSGSEIAPPMATDITSGWGVLALDNGNAYVSITNGILRVTPTGGKAMITNLMSGSADYWNFLTLYSEGKVLCARDLSSDYSNIVVVDGTATLGYLRPDMVGGAETLPKGLAYLE